MCMLDHLPSSSSDIGNLLLTPHPPQNSRCLSRSRTPRAKGVPSIAVELADTASFLPEAVRLQDGSPSKVAATITKPVSSDILSHERTASRSTIAMVVSLHSTILPFARPFIGLHVDREIPTLRPTGDSSPLTLTPSLRLFLRSCPPQTH